jgi:hypothetical protein
MLPPNLPVETVERVVISHGEILNTEMKEITI